MGLIYVHFCTFWFIFGGFGLVWVLFRIVLACVVFFFIVLVYFWLLQVLLGLILECFGLFLVVLARLGSLQVVFGYFGSVGFFGLVLGGFGLF